MFACLVHFIKQCMFSSGLQGVFGALMVAVPKTAGRRAHMHRNVWRHVRVVVLKAVSRYLGCQSVAGHARSRRSRMAALRPVTLIEVCCSPHSATSKAVGRHKGAAMRVTWPPPKMPLYVLNSQKDPPCKAHQLALLREPPRLRAGARAVPWYLNIDWPFHRAALMDLMRKMRPAPGTKKVVLLTSPECRMMSQIQRIQHAKGTFDWQAHAVAMQRLRFLRRLHRVWRLRRRNENVAGVAIHEQPPCSAQNLLGSYDEPNDFPWAIAVRSMRRTVHGCMCGVVDVHGIPVFKGWRFETDCPFLAEALSGHNCDGSHVHARTTMNNRSKPPPGSTRHMSHVSAFEAYPPYLGTLLCFASGVTLRNKP